MARRLRNPETKRVSQCQSCLKIDSGKLLRAHSNKVINVSCGFVVAAVTMTFTCTGDPGVECSGKGRDFRPIYPDDCPYDPLCREGRCAVPKTEGSVQEDFASPSNGEENARDRVQGEPSIPPGEINLEDKDSFARVFLSGFLDESYDGG